ncbi:hypothetical protein SIID45300_02267 [Candidatus Magnetaquicoccaceae bacterium FCR-1]|uniref:Uncharacterized protein n=1 Tax=Candidatus Magnetaquiglobus chichijimensis TaxID=3141448 RepID=A0ABQ0CAM1_9PROT
MDTMQDILLRLGEINGTLEAMAKRQEEMTEWLHGLDSRLRAVEIKAALWGIAGGGCGMAAFQFLSR